MGLSDDFTYPCLETYLQRQGFGFFLLGDCTGWDFR